MIYKQSAFNTAQEFVQGQVGKADNKKMQPYGRGEDGVGGDSEGRRGG